MATKARRGRPRGTKRPQSDCEIESVTKRQKLIDMSFDFIDIDTVSGDLMIIFESHKTAYNVDSKVIQRASPVLYEQCIAVRPSDGSEWTFKYEGRPRLSKETAEAILHLIHSNMDQIPKALDLGALYNAFTFAIRYEMFDRYKISLEQWYDATSRPGSEELRNCSRLWLAHKLGHTELFTLQKWAIFNLFDDGKGGLGVPSEELSPETSPGKPFDLAVFTLSDKTVIGQMSQLRSKAVDFIFAKLREVHLAMLSSEDGTIKHFSCRLCLGQWFKCFTKGLLQPEWVDPPLGQTFPSLFPMIGGGLVEFHRPLKELCAFVKSLEDKMKRDRCKCCAGQRSPPPLVTRLHVDHFIDAGFVDGLLRQ